MLGLGLGWFRVWGLQLGRSGFGRLVGFEVEGLRLRGGLVHVRSKIDG